MDDTIENSSKIAQNSVGLPKEFFGIFGMMEFPSGPYLILIQRAIVMGEILKCHVFRVEELLFIPLNNAVQPYTISVRDQPYIDMILNLQKDKSFYFSYKLDLTKRI